MIDQIECTGELRILDWQDAEFFYGEGLFCQTAGVENVMLLERQQAAEQP